MMGHQPPYQNKLFIAGFNLEKRIREDHILRKIAQQIDFNFIYREVKDTYGDNGNVSVPPPVILKMMLLLALFNVRSERELMDTIPLRLDWLWFLGYDIDTGIKLGLNHPMGPLTLLDFVGLDTTYNIANMMFEEYREKRYAPPPLLKKMVLAGYYGRKSEKGFYGYSGEKPVPINLGI